VAIRWSNSAPRGLWLGGWTEGSGSTCSWSRFPSGIRRLGTGALPAPCLRRHPRHYGRISSVLERGPGRAPAPLCHARGPLSSPALSSLRPRGGRPIPARGTRQDRPPRGGEDQGACQPGRGRPRERRRPEDGGHPGRAEASRRRGIRGGPGGLFLAPGMACAGGGSRPSGRARRAPSWNGTSRRPRSTRAGGTSRLRRPTGSCLPDGRDSMKSLPATGRRSSPSSRRARSISRTRAPGSRSSSFPRRPAKPCSTSAPRPGARACRSPTRMGRGGSSPLDLPGSRIDRLKENLSRTTGVEAALVQADLLKGPPRRS
jgi:hypothetical protein